MKAWEGFADRLQVLSHLINYCLVNRAILCVDWRDKNWGQGKWDFSDFFELIGMPVISIEMVSKMENATIVPSCWTLETIEKPMTAVQLQDKFICPIMRNNFEKIEGDIIVTNGKGFRKFFSENIIKNIRFTKPVAELIQKKLQDFYLPATVIHLRGTDRYNPNLINEWFKEFDTLVPHSKARVYHISDSTNLIDEWTKKVPQSELCIKDTSTLKIPTLTKCGTHQLSEETLESYGSTKYDLIIDALADFMALSFATNAIGNPKSVFFEMARLISRSGPKFTGEILGGYQPKYQKSASVAKDISSTVFPTPTLE